MYESLQKQNLLFYAFTLLLFFYLQNIASLLRQPHSFRWQKNWCRQWMGVWWMACLVLSVAYISYLLSFLTVPLYYPRIENVKQLAKSKLRYVYRKPKTFIRQHFYILIFPY